MKTISFTVAQLTNGSQFAFIKAIIKAARKCEAIVSNAKKQLELLEKMFAVEDDVMLRHAKSPLTAKIQELDAERDRLYRMVRSICKSMTEMLDPDTKQKAIEVHDIIAAYGWIPTFKYDRQTGMLENLCQDLQGSHAQMVEALGLTKAVADLKQANDNFAAFVAERSESRGEFVRGEMAAARQDTEQAYYALIEVVNSLSTLFIASGGAAAENPYADFINYANQEINRLKISELKQKTRSEEAEPLLGHEFGWENPADGTDPDYPTYPGENTPSTPGGGTNEPTEPGGSTNPPTTEPETPSTGGDSTDDELTAATGITVKWTYNRAAVPEGSLLAKEMIVAPGTIIPASEWPEAHPGFHWNSTPEQMNDSVPYKRPGEWYYVREQPDEEE